jgi:hypothetical protein
VHVSPEAAEALKSKLEKNRWTAGVNSDGYPKVKIDGVSYLASHVLLHLLGRPVPKGKVVMHLDNDPLNLDPKNLRIGTQQQNLKQMRDEGRDRPRGVPQEPDAKQAHVRWERRAGHHPPHDWPTERTEKKAMYEFSEDARDAAHSLRGYAKRAALDPLDVSKLEDFWQNRTSPYARAAAARLGEVRGMTPRQAFEVMHLDAQAHGAPFQEHIGTLLAKDKVQLPSTLLRTPVPLSDIPLTPKMQNWQDRLRQQNAQMQAPANAVIDVPTPAPRPAAPAPAPPVPAAPRPLAQSTVPRPKPISGLRPVAAAVPRLKIANLYFLPAWLPCAHTPSSRSLPKKLSW